MSIVRESSWRSSASRSASSTTTNWPLATSQPLDGFVVSHLAVVLGTPALLLDRRKALAVQQAERDVRLPRGRLRGGRGADEDAHEAEAQRSVPADAHDSPSLGRTAVIRSRREVPSDYSPLGRDGRKSHHSLPLARSRLPQRGGRLSRRDRGRLARGAMDRGAERVELLANGLLSRGVRKGDAFGILARNTLERRCSTSRSATSARSAPRSTRTPRPTTCATLEHSEAIGVLCEDDEQRGKVEGRLLAPACATC